MSTALVSCSGVLQPKRLSNGALTIVERALHLDNVVTFLRRHRDSPLKLAVTLAHEQQFDRIVMFGHSKGATFCCDVAEELHDFGATVTKAVFADGWNRSGTLVVPANVAEVEAWVQSYERPDIFRRPHGSDIHLESSDTKFALHEAPPDVGHAFVDDLPEVIECVLAACRS